VNLRPYQTAFVTNIRAALAQSKKIIACAATGSGKTKTFLSISNTALSKGTTVLILTESRKIFSQIAAEVPTAVNISAKQKFIFVEPGRLYVAMAQTLARRPRIVEQFQALGSRLLIINDEAHIGTATKLLEQLPAAYLIGFTATPDFKVAKHLPKIYRGIVVGPQPQELVEAGFLAPYYHYERRGVDTAGLAKDSRGEFTEASQYEAFTKTKIYAGIHDDLNRAAYSKAIIFCSSIKHAQNLTAELRAAGYEAAEVHTENQHADRELFKFTHGGVKICVSVGILTKGFDFPQIDMVILMRATTSLALYLQMIGRGSRQAHGKEHFTVLDYGGNGSRHGLWSAEHEWAEKWRGKEKKKKDGTPPVKECPVCFLLVAPSMKVCPECGHVFKATAAELAEGEMINLLSDYDKIRGKFIGSLTPPELAIYARTTNKKAFAARVAKSKGAEYLADYGREMNYNEWWAKRNETTESLDFFNVLIK